MLLEKKKFKEINLDDPFFSSLKSDYAEFPNWFAKKAEDHAYVFHAQSGGLDGFLYLKVEEGAILDCSPPLPPSRRIKVGTLKINAHGTKLGERFIKKIFDHAIHEEASEIYLTVFSHHQGLLALLTKYGFLTCGEKKTQNGSELVMVRALHSNYADIVENYPMIRLDNARPYLLSLQPQWHTRLLPDSILANENANIVQDVSHANSIHKVYLAAMDGLQNLVRGDVLLIYRTTDGLGAAHYRSVATSVCVVEEYRSIHSFSSIEEFLQYCRPHSVFTDAELHSFWAKKKYPHIIRFTYNTALKKRVTRGVMIEEIGLNPQAYWGFLPLTRQQFIEVVRTGNIDESLIIN
jgi:hypothetical protein